MKTTKSLFALALHAWNLSVLLVVLFALILLAPAAVVIAFPVACMAASLYLLCAITARLLAPFVPPPDRRPRRRRCGVRERRKQECVEVDRAEAPGGFDDDASSAEEDRGEGEGTEREGGRHEVASLYNEISDYSCDGEQRQFFFVDTGSYYKSFYDLLAFWRSVERGDWR